MLFRSADGQYRRARCSRGGPPARVTGRRCATDQDGAVWTRTEEVAGVGTIDHRNMPGCAHRSACGVGPTRSEVHDCSREERLVAADLRRFEADAVHGERRRAQLGTAGHLRQLRTELGDGAALVQFDVVERCDRDEHQASLPPSADQPRWAAWKVGIVRRSTGPTPVRQSFRRGPARARARAARTALPSPRKRRCPVLENDGAQPSKTTVPGSLATRAPSRRTVSSP